MVIIVVTCKNAERGGRGALQKERIQEPYDGDPAWIVHERPVKPPICGGKLVTEEVKPALLVADRYKFHQSAPSFRSPQEQKWSGHTTFQQSSVAPGLVQIKISSTKYCRSCSFLSR